MARRNGQGLSLWSDGSSYWLFIADLMPESRERGVSIVQVEQYSEEGVNQDTRRWICRQVGQWRRYTD